MLLLIEFLANKEIYDREGSKHKMPLPTIKALHERPVAILYSQHPLWAMTIFTIAASSVLLGFTVAINVKSPGRPSMGSDCDNRNNPVFWQMITQLLLHVLFIFCVLAPVLRDKEGWLHVHKFWFYASIATSLLSAVLGVVLYSTLCDTGGWMASLLLGWASAATAAGAAAQLAGGIRKS